MARTRFFLLACLLLHAQIAAAAWTTRDADEPGLNPIAYSLNDSGQRVEILLRDGDTIYLRLVLGEGFETFGETNCPTFQIDKRTPMHHFDVGERCAIGSKQATFTLGQISDRAIKSLILHRLMNGNKVTFRYTVNNGQYRQASFSLRNSKQALRLALGSGIRVSAD